MYYYCVPHLYTVYVYKNIYRDEHQFGRAFFIKSMIDILIVIGHIRLVLNYHIWKENNYEHTDNTESKNFEILKIKIRKEEKKMNST